MGQIVHDESRLEELNDGILHHNYNGLILFDVAISNLRYRPADTVVKR